MKLNAAEFMAYAKTIQSQSWETKTGRQFSFEVVNHGIRLVPSTGSERNISHSEIGKFCAIYSEYQSDKTSDYSELFNKSYLLSIIKNFNREPVEFALPEEMGVEHLHQEGAVKQVTINAYERSDSARRKCIEAHGTKCSICSFDFGETFGEFASGFIHVHHLYPIAASQGTRVVDPVEDLRPVCPNCHAVIHWGGGCLSIEEVQALRQNTI